MLIFLLLYRTADKDESKTQNVMIMQN